MFNLSEKITELEKRLRSNSAIDVDEFNYHFIEKDEEGQLDIDFVYNRYRNKLQYNFDDSFKEIININEFYFHGILKIDSYFTKLEICIEKVGSGLFLISYDEGLWFEGQPEDGKALWKTFRSFDTRPEIGDGKMAVFSIQEGVSPPNEPAIYYIDRAFCCKTNLTFVQYYQAVLDMMGIADWQLLFIDVALKDPMISYKYDGLKKSLTALAKASPEKDYSGYFKLLEDRWVE